MKDYASLDDDKKVCIELPFVEVYRIFKTDNLFAIAINPVGINLVINRDVMGVATKNIELHNNPNVLVERNGEEVDYDDNEEVEEEAPSNRYKDEETSDLRKKVLEHFIETQKGVIEKHKDDTSEEGQEKLKKAQQKLAEFEKQLEALND